LARLERLERSNRRMRVFCALSLVAPLAAVVGWQVQEPVPDVLRAHRIEVVNATGVPMIVLSVDRTGDGGNVTLRDRLGEKRSWWQVGPGTAAFAMVSEGNQDAQNATVGLSVAPRKAELSLFSGNGAAVSTGVRNEQPRLDLWNAKGTSLFSAPFKGKP